MNWHVRLGAGALLVASAGCNGGTESQPPGPPVEVRAVAGAPATAPFAADLSTPFEARVLDAGGEGVPNVLVEWSASGGTITPAQAVSGADGTARATWTSPTATGQHTVSATAATAAGPGPFSSR